MSYKAYEILTTEPDFNQEPVMGFGEGGRNDLRVGMIPGFSEWSGDTSLAFKFLYRLSTPEIATGFREFMHRQKGRWNGFFLPSWQSDFTLEASAIVGATTLTVSEFGFAELTENRPDTEKRICFALNTEGQIQTFQVLSAVDNGGNEDITIDTPLTIAIDPETTMMGVCYLVRLADDRQDYNYDAPGQASVELRFVSLRNKRTVETQETVESTAIGSSMKAFEDLLAEDLDPELATYDSPEATGPSTYGTPQAANYSAPWEATFISGPIVQFENLDTALTTNSSLFDGGSAADHLAFCFDEVSLEVLAWDNQTIAGQIRCRWYESAIAQALNFDGFSPVAFNTWIIDSTVTAGGAEVAIFYLKPGYSVIFARLKRDSFATEYQMLSSPSGPLYLHKVERNNAIIEIHGMDAGHRKVRWRSATYSPPVADGFGSFVSLEDGAYTEIAIIGTDGDGQGASVELTTGTYEDVNVPAAPEGDGAGASVALEAGSYDQIVIPATGGDSAKASVTLEDGAYTLTAQNTGAQGDGAGATVELTTGSYGTP